VVKPTVSVTSVAVKEGNSGQRTLVFKVTLSQATTVPVSVKVATADGTARSGKDYVKASKTLTFAPGTTTLTFQVKVNGDRVREKDETFRVNLGGVTNGTAGKGGVGTIRNDDR